MQFISSAHALYTAQKLMYRKMAHYMQSKYPLLCPAEYFQNSFTLVYTLFCNVRALHTSASTGFSFSYEFMSMRSFQLLYRYTTYICTRYACSASVTVFMLFIYIEYPHATHLREYAHFIVANVTYGYVSFSIGLGTY